MGTGRRLAVAGHLTVVELFERYRGAEDPVVKAHLQVIWLKAQGWKTGAVARSTGFKPDWVRRLLHRYNEQGPESLGDRRAGNGRDPLLSEAQRRELLKALGKPAPYGGLWSSAKVARWIGEWLYLYGFVRPGGGQVEWLLLPEVDTAIFSLALKHFAKAVDAGPKKHILLVLDRAGWHLSKDLEVPEGIHLVLLPAYSPELQPAEHLWPLVLGLIRSGGHRAKGGYGVPHGPGVKEATPSQGVHG